MDKTTINLTDGTVVKLEKGGEYIILIDDRQITQEMARQLNDVIKNEFKAKGVVVLVRGDPSNIKVLELPEKM